MSAPQTWASRYLPAGLQNISKAQQSVENIQIVPPHGSHYSGPMKRKQFLLLTVLWSGSLAAAAQSGSIVGTWALTAADKLLPDGTPPLIMETTRTVSSSSQPTATTLLSFIAL